MNPEWAAQRGTSTWNNNEKAAAWLCDPTKWTSYCNTEYANYAIGGPSVEMYVKSYNQTHGANALGYQYQTNNVPGYGYKVNGIVQNSGWWTNADTLDYSTTYDSMYCGKGGNKVSGEVHWWLASPSAYIFYFVCFVDGGNATLSSCNSAASRAVSPLVSLKSSFTPIVEE